MTETINNLNALLKNLSPESDPIIFCSGLPDIMQVVDTLSELRSKAQQALDLCRDLREALTPSADATKNEVLTIGGYIAEGYTPEEACLTQRHDILWNEYVDGTITLDRYTELAEIWAMDIV